MERVVKIVAPLRVEAVSAPLRGRDEPGIVEVRLRYYGERPAKLSGERLDLALKLLEEVGRRRVDDRVDRVQPECVDVEVAQPHQCVVDEEATDFVSVGVVEVDRLSPRRAVLVREIRSELAQVVARRAEVVV